ncbi:MAG: nucleotide exchange factor GrpE [Armatimonadetes bacterium]|nr:nucleotide exchange factor GrpE [Armatimonadota bacterium]
MSSSPAESLQSLREQIAALPARLQVAGDEEGVSASDAPLAIIARQGRLILRLTAAVEGMEAKLRTQENTRSVADWETELAIAREEAGRVLREAALPLMDALEFAAQTAQEREDGGLAAALSAARRDGLRRLAIFGVSEIPASVGTAFDGRLHEAVETRPIPNGSSINRYEIVSVVRPGYQQGTEVLRRTTVITAE